METGMIPAGGNAGAVAVAQQPKGIVAPTMDMMGGGGGGFSEAWAINKDRHVFVNKKTNEERKELYVVIDEMHPGRALFPKAGPQKGERVCYSDDGKSSYQGIDCNSCPHVSEVKAFNGYYEAHQNVQRPQQYLGDCSLRYSLYWTKEFVVNPDGSITLQVREQRALLNAPKSSIYAMWGNDGYKTTVLDKQGLDITKVVTKIKLAQRHNKDLNSDYDYADFELIGTIESVMAKVTKTVQITADQTPNAAPAASYPAGAPAGLPQMAGQPATPPPAQTGFPPVSGGFPGTSGAALPPAATTTAAAPGFPSVAAAAPAATPPAAAPGFPPVAGAAATPAATPATPAPSFQDMMRQKLVQDFGALGNEVKAVVLNVLGVQKIEDVSNEKLINATQAVASAKNFNAPAATGGAAPKNPF